MSVNEVQRALASLFGSVDDAKRAESSLRRRNRKGGTAEESAALGAACLNDGDFDAAIHHFQTANKQRSEQDIGGRLDLGSALEAAGRPAEALRQYQKAARIQSRAPEPHLGVSQIYKQHGKFKKSIAELERAIELDPGNPYYRFKLAELHRQLRSFGEAILAATAAAAAAPADSFYHYWVADLLIELGRFEEALQPMRLALELTPGDDFFYSRASIAFWGARKPKEAIRAIRLASDLDPDKPLYHGLLAFYLRREGMNEEAAHEETIADKMDAYDSEELGRIVELVG